jgi:hypothetical protein
MIDRCSDLGCVWVNGVLATVRLPDRYENYLEVYHGKIGG